MFYSFRLHKENENITEVLAILEGLGAVVLSIVGNDIYHSTLPEAAYSERFMLNHIKKFLRDTYQSAGFVAGTAGSIAFKYAFREFQIEAKMELSMVKQLTAKYQIGSMRNIVESSRFEYCSDFVECQSFRLSCCGRELFSSNKMECLKDSSVRLLMPIKGSLQFYVLYRFIVMMDSEVVYNNLVIVFKPKPKELEVHQIRNKQLIWLMKASQPIRYFYRQNRQECYLHPMLGRYYEVEDLFYRGDIKNMTNIKVELSFTPDHCEKQEFLRIADTIRQSEQLNEYDFVIKSSENTCESAREDVLTLVSLDTDGEWHNFSSQAFGFRAARDEFRVKQAVLTPQGLLPSFHTFWVYDEPESKRFTEGIILVNTSSGIQPTLSFDWRYPFMGMSSGKIRIGVSNFLFVGGSKLNQLRREFYLIYTQKLTKNMITPKFVDTFGIKEMFSLNRKERIRNMKTINPPSYQYANGQFIGWINAELIQEYTLHPVQRVLVKVGNKTGYVLPIFDLKEGRDLYVWHEGVPTEEITVIEVVPEQRAYITDQLLQLFSKFLVTYQELRRIHQEIYRRNCRLIKNYLATQVFSENVTNEQYAMAPVISHFKENRLSRQLLNFLCEEFENDSKYYPIGIKLNVLFAKTKKSFDDSYLVQTSSQVPGSANLMPDEIMARTRLTRAVVIIRTVYGVRLVGVKCVKGDYNKYLAKAKSNYIIMSDSLQRIVADQQVTLITCPYLTKILYSEQDILSEASILLKSFRLEPHKGHESYTRKYLEGFSCDQPTIFNETNDRQNWRLFVDSAPDELLLPQRVSGEAAEVLMWVSKQMEEWLRQAKCNYFEFVFHPVNLEHLYRLKTHFLSNTPKQVRLGLQELLRSESKPIFKYREFLCYSLGI